MTADFELVKQLLESRLRKATRQNGRDSIEVRTSADPADTLQQAIDRETASRDLDRSALLIRSLHQALDRIGDGTYGICRACEGPIPMKRLAAAPWASLCLSCQEMSETAFSDDQPLAA